VGYELAKERFGDKTITETNGQGERGNGKLIMKDRITDGCCTAGVAPREYSVIAAPNLTGDLLSDAARPRWAGSGSRPGQRGRRLRRVRGDPRHRPKYAGQDKVNPGSVILSGAMMFEELGWDDVATAIARGLGGAIRRGASRTIWRA